MLYLKKYFSVYCVFLAVWMMYREGGEGGVWHGKGRGQRTTFSSHLFHYTLAWILTIRLTLPGLLGQELCLDSQIDRLSKTCQLWWMTWMYITSRSELSFLCTIADISSLSSVCFYIVWLSPIVQLFGFFPCREDFLDILTEVAPVSFKSSTGTFLALDSAVISSYALLILWLYHFFLTFSLQEKYFLFVYLSF